MQLHPILIGIRKLKERWLQEFVDLAVHRSKLSRDANTKVGAVIVDEENLVEVSIGYNCLARGVHHKPERSERPLKYFFTAHAEQNAIANSARLGRSTNGCSIVVSMFPCSVCASMLINAGIKKVYSPAPDWNHPKYKEEFQHSLDQFNEAGVELIHIDGLMP